MMDALRYADQAEKELNFFGGTFFDQPGATAQSGTYEQDYSGVWA